MGREGRGVGEGGRGEGDCSTDFKFGTNTPAGPCPPLSTQLCRHLGPRPSIACIPYACPSRAAVKIRQIFLILPKNIF